MRQITGEHAQWRRLTLCGHAVVYLVGLMVVGVNGELTYAVAVTWALALAATLVVGVMLLAFRGARKQGGVVVGTLVASVFELVLSIAMALIWLRAHPGWELS